MNQRISEYDAFGPWIYEIDGQHALPAVFAGHLDESVSPLMLVKIPVDAERRSLKPGMLMYDCVIGLYADHLLLLRYSGGSVSETTIAYASIRALAYSIDLLRGEFDIHTKEGRHSVKFNAASEPLMQKLIAIMRNKITNTGRHGILDGLAELNADFGFFFRGLADAMKKQDASLRVIGYQGQTDLRYRKRGLVSTLVERMMRPCLAGSLHLLGEKELIIINRGNASDFRRHPIHKYGFTYIPAAAILGISKGACTEFRDVIEYSIRLDAPDITLRRHESCRTLSYLDRFCG